MTPLIWTSAYTVYYSETSNNNCESTVINNGYISDWFKPERGVRQGCPLTTYLFILKAELLALSVRQNNNIKGITVENTKIKLSQLANDTTCFWTVQAL